MSADYVFCGWTRHHSMGPATHPVAFMSMRRWKAAFPLGWAPETNQRASGEPQV